MPDRAALLDRHQSAIERAEARAVRRVAAAYRNAWAELLARLLDAWPGTVTTPEQAAAVARQLGLVQQIDGRLLELEQELGLILRDVVTVSSETAIQQIERELALLPASVGGPSGAAALQFGQINFAMIEQFLPVALNEARIASRTLSLQLQRELQSGLIQGEGFVPLVQRMMSSGTTASGASVWRRGEISAALSTRRTVITAENAAKQAVLGEAQRAIPAVRKQAIAAMGPDTTDTCLRVHGQIQPVDQPFELTGTPRFADAMQFPAFHWNCRTSVAMWHPAFEQGSATTERMRERAQAELRKR